MFQNFWKFCSCSLGSCWLTNVPINGDIYAVRVSYCGRIILKEYTTTRIYLFPAWSHCEIVFNYMIIFTTSTVNICSVECTAEGTVFIIYTFATLESQSTYYLTREVHTPNKNILQISRSWSQSIALQFELIDWWMYKRK